MLKNDDHDGVYDWTALFFQKQMHFIWVSMYLAWKY